MKRGTFRFRDHVLHQSLLLASVIFSLPHPLDYNHRGWKYNLEIELNEMILVLQNGIRGLNRFMPVFALRDDHSAKMCLTSLAYGQCNFAFGA